MLLSPPPLHRLFTVVRGKKLGPRFAKDAARTSHGNPFHLGEICPHSLRTFPKILLFLFLFIYLFILLALLLLCCSRDWGAAGDTAAHLLFPCCHRFYARDNMRNKPCHTSEGPPFIRAAAIWKLLLSQTTVFVKCDREKQAFCKWNEVTWNGDRTFPPPCKTSGSHWGFGRNRFADNLG